MRIGERDPERMTPEQKRAYDAIASGPRGSVPLPFLAMLDAPHVADALQAVGAAIRFSGKLPDTLREVCILATAAAFGSGYEWDYHVAIARQLEIPEAVLKAAWTGGLGDPTIELAYAAAIALCRGAVLERRIAHEHFDALIGLIGREAASEVVAIAGYYPALALFLSASGVDEPARDTA